MVAARSTAQSPRCRRINFPLIYFQRRINFSKSHFQRRINFSKSHFQRRIIPKKSFSKSHFPFDAFVPGLFFVHHP
jgi:hypothetical protein